MENTKTLYAKLKKKEYLSNIIYLTIGLIALILLVYWLITVHTKYLSDEKENTFKITIIIIAYFLSFFTLLVIFMGYFFNIHFLKGHLKTIKYYKENELTNIKELIVDYDAKQWLTAPKDTYHSLTFKYRLNDEEEIKVVTDNIFTNSTFHYIFPRFLIPEELQAKNYITNIALAGYDNKKEEVVLIGFRKRNG